MEVPVTTRKSSTSYATTPLQLAIGSLRPASDFV